MVDRTVGIGPVTQDFLTDPDCIVDQEFDELMDGFRKLKEGKGSPSGVMGKVDPAVFLVRRKVIEAALKDLLHRSAAVRTLSMDLKKMVGKRLANAVWKGYLLGLAWQERLGNAPKRSMVDATYLWSVYQELLRQPLEAKKEVTDLGPEAETEMGIDVLPTNEVRLIPDGMRPPVTLDAAVTKALSRIQYAEAQTLSGTLAAAGAGAAVNHGTSDGSLLENVVGELAMKGFMIWKAQQRALGTE
jgi:hypothetical protein